MGKSQLGPILYALAPQEEIDVERSRLVALRPLSACPKLEGLA